MNALQIIVCGLSAIAVLWGTYQLGYSNGVIDTTLKFDALLDHEDAPA